jgi:hypothetical protein
VNLRILSLLWQQFQFKLTFALCLWIIFLGAWKDSYGFCINADALNKTCTVGLVVHKTIDAIMIWSPLLLILLLDAIKVQSNTFRIAMPLAYAVQILTHVGLGVVAENGKPLIESGVVNSTVLQGIRPEREMTSSLVTIALLMSNVIFALVRYGCPSSDHGQSVSKSHHILLSLLNRYPAGNVIFFPNKFRVWKSEVDCGQLVTRQRVTYIMTRTSSPLPSPASPGWPSLARNVLASQSSSVAPSEAEATSPLAP